MDIITSEISNAAIKLVADIVKERFSRSTGGHGGQERPLVAGSVEGHLQEVLKWSERDQFFGMSIPHDVDKSTVALMLHTEPRRFRSSVSSHDTKGEGDLLADRENYLLLGEPGSGKTTTLKRIARRLLTQEPTAVGDSYQYPVVLRLRQMKLGASLDTSLADVLGVPYEWIEISKEGHLSSSTYREAKVSNRRLIDYLADLFNSTGAVLLLDGLDEVLAELRPSLEADIVSLGLKLAGSKIILSTRSGDYSKQLEGFNIVEIWPLTPAQIRSIAGKWLHDEQDFFGQLSRLPYYDVADRPLLLTQLLFLYRRNGYLPEQPSLVYEKLVNLLLQDWDVQRDVIRRSKYAGFTPERKAAFLASLAYHLTYKTKTKSFSGQDLVLVYHEIHTLFNIPRAEAHLVAQEIQSHSGLIVATQGGHYEFAHLSLQEYFCAQYVVREPFPEAMEGYIASYPSPLAVAVCLSSNPGNWFAGLILREMNFGAFTPESLLVFLSRLALERPFFGRSVFAGMAFCKIFRECKDDRFASINMALDIKDVALRLACRDDALESIADSLFFFKVDVEASKHKDYILLRRRLFNPNQYGIDTPPVGALPLALARKLKSGSMNLVWQDEKGNLQPYTLED